MVVKLILVFSYLITVISISDTGHITMRNSEKCFYGWNDFWNAAPKIIQKRNRSIVPPLTLERFPVMSYREDSARMESALRISRRKTDGVMITSNVYRDLNVEQPAV